MSDTRVSKFLALVLRHDPGRVGIALDPNGWVPVNELLDALRRHGTDITRADLERIVQADVKDRYALEGDRIRANQGHSVAVDLDLPPVQPPNVLFHGTAERFVESILRNGINRGARQFVHLSPDAETAAIVGSRRGRPAVLTIAARVMADHGLVFYRSANGVWLTDHVPAQYVAPPALRSADGRTGRRGRAV